MTNTNRTTDSLTALLHQAKSCYTITDKTTGQVLGHAFMQGAGLVTADQVQLLPYQEPAVENIQPLPSSALHDETEFRGILESDLDLSEDSSMNATVEEDFSSQTCDLKKCPELSTHQADMDVEIIQSRSVPSIGEDQASRPPVIQTASTSFKQASPLPSNAKSVTQSIAAQILSEMSCGEVSRKKSCQSSVMNSSNVESRNKAAEQKDNEHQVTGKRKSSSDEQPAKKVNHGNRFTTGKYEALYTEEGVEQRVNQKFKNRRVRCLLCPDGRTLVFGNFGMHVKALHLGDVTCEGCGVEFKASKINFHKRKCVVEKDSRSVVNNETQNINMVSSRISHPESAQSPKYTQPQDSVNMSSSSELFVSDNSFASCTSSLVLETNKNVNINNNPVLSKNLRSDEVDMITFILTSAAKESVKIKIKTVMGGKMKKVMKKFGEKLCVDIQGLKFLLGGVELSGEELACELEGRNIVVMGGLQ